MALAQAGPTFATKTEVTCMTKHVAIAGFVLALAVSSFSPLSSAAQPFFAPVAGMDASQGQMAWEPGFQAGDYSVIMLYNVRQREVIQLSPDEEKWRSVCSQPHFGYAGWRLPTRAEISRLEYYSSGQPYASDSGTWGSRQKFDPSTTPAILTCVHSPRVRYPGEPEPVPQPEIEQMDAQPVAPQEGYHYVFPAQAAPVKQEAAVTGRTKAAGPEPTQAEIARVEADLRRMAADAEERAKVQDAYSAQRQQRSAIDAEREAKIGTAQADYQKALAEREAEIARIAATDDEVKKAYEAEVADWQARVLACRSGKVSQCAPGGQ